MFMNRRRIKRKAKASLEGLWGSAVALLLLLTAVSALFVLLERTVVSLTGMMTLEQIISSFPIYRSTFFTLPFAGAAVILFLCCRFLSFLFRTPLVQGYVSWFYRRALGETPDVYGAFFYYHPFRRWVKTIVIDLWLGVKKAFWHLVFLSPAIAIFSFAGIIAPYIDAGWHPFLLTAVPVVLGTFGALIARIVCYRYFAVRYIYADDPSVSVRVLFRSSVRVIKGSKRALFMLDLSLIPAYLISLAVLPCIWTVPYINMIRAFFARKTIERYQEKILSDREEADQGETYDEF